MRKYLFVLFVIISYTNLSAQLVRGWGIKVGATVSNQTWDYSSPQNIDFESEDKFGLNVGIFLEFLDIPFFSIITELNYIQKGVIFNILQTTEVSSAVNGLVDWDTRIDYLNIAALAKIRLNFSVLKPYILLGPKIDYEIGKSFGEVNVRDIENQFNESRVGAKVGVGTEIDLSTVTLLVEVLYDADFTEIYDNQNLKVSSNSFDLRVGLFF